MTDLRWWPEPGSDADAKWASETLRVVRQVAQNTAGRLGYARDSLDRSDLDSWLTLQALEFREDFRPPSGSDRDVLQAWCGTLNKVLTTQAFFHYTDVNHRAGLAKDQIRYTIGGQDSVDRQLPGKTVDQATTVGDLGRPLWVGQRPVEPEHRVVELDRLRTLAVRRARIKPKIAQRLTYLEALWILDQSAPDPGAGQCAVWGCTRPPARGSQAVGAMCASHIHQAHKEAAKPCSADDCHRPVQARGLCSTHYERWRLERAPECSVEDCTRKARTRGMCQKHVTQARKDGTISRAIAHPGGDVNAGKECTVDGCDKRRYRGELCRNHSYAERQKTARPCIEEGCSKPQFCRQMCSAHYTRWIRAQHKEAS